MRLHRNICLFARILSVAAYTWVGIPVRQYGIVESAGFHNLFVIKEITKQIIKLLVIEKGHDKIIATDKFYDSNTFAKLADKTTLFYEKDRNEIYKLLLNELNI
jgi:hypothetical protein